MIFRKIILLGFIFVTLSAGLSGGLKKTRQAVELDPIPIPAGVETASIAVKEIITHIPNDTIIGQAEGGLACVKKGNIRADAAEYYVTNRPYREILSRELISQNYNILHQQKTLFNTLPSENSNFLIGGLIMKMEGNVCFPNVLIDNSQRSKGSAFLEIEWQVFDVKNQKVVLTLSTQGSAIVKKKVTAGLGVALDGAFTMAARNLMADERFYSLMVESYPANPN